MLGSLERLVPRFRTDINMIGRHLIIATGHQGRGRFAHDQFPSGEIPEKRFKILLMVVERPARPRHPSGTDDSQGLPRYSRR